MKINLNYEDRKYFHPRPSLRMKETIYALLNNFNWEIEVPVEKLTREEAKELIGKGVKAARRKKVRIFDTPIDKVNRELTFI